MKLEKPFPKWVVPMLKFTFVTAFFAIMGPLKCLGKKRVPKTGGLLILVQSSGRRRSDCASSLLPSPHLLHGEIRAV